MANASPTSSEPKAVPGRLRSLLSNRPVPILLIGAGASVSSGIPAAAATVALIAKYRWCLDHNRSFGDPRVVQADYWPWLLSQSWFNPDRDPGDLYPEAIKHLLNVDRDRREFFETLINPPVEPNRGYRALVEILQQRWITTVLTTNFDECVQKAQRLIGRPHNLISIKTASDLVRFTSAPEDPQLVYLHGSVEHYTDKNRVDDVQSLDPAIVERVKPLMRDHPIIVVGYRGTEPSVMDGLFDSLIDDTHNFAQGVYWCVLDREADKPLSPLVQRLASRIGGNFNKVPIAGFDHLMDDELWRRMSAEGARPVPGAGGDLRSDRPFDMRVIASAMSSDLDQVLLFTRLREYAAVIRIWSPDAFEEDWTLETATSFNLLAKTEAGHVPTFAGCLLFSKVPGTLIPNARVEFVAEGPSEWLRSCFGEDADLAEHEPNVYRVESVVAGTLWAQLDGLLDLLSLVNSQFRLKEETSRQVRAYSPLALKEMIVNALAHRDYESDASIRVTVTPHSITTTSPGGLIEAVRAEINGENIETLIKAGRRHIKGYRNPVVADLLYGGGAMDHTGSGLSDMWKESINNNGDADFGPEEDNSCFRVTIYARPEAVNRITNTAVPLDHVQTIRFATNLVPFVDLPDRVWHAGTSQAATWLIRKAAGDLPVPDGHVHGGRFYTLFDLAELADRYVTPFDSDDIEELSIGEFLALPHGPNTFVKLLTDSVFAHLRTIGVYVDGRHKRAHFKRLEEAPERKVTYQGRVKRATRTVVKARTKRDSSEISWYEHKALSISCMNFGGSWAIALTPGYAFTRNGYGKLIGRELTNSLSTRRAAKDFNLNVHNDMTFWLAVLSEGAEGVFALKPDCESHVAQFAPTITLSDRLPTVSYRSDAFGDEDRAEDGLDADLEALDAELEALAAAEDEVATVAGTADAPVEDEHDA